MQRIDEILRELGLNNKYTGYSNIIDAVDIVTNNKHALYSVTKSIYIPIAEEKGITWSAVERSIRTAIKRAWMINPNLIIQMAGYKMIIHPTASEFIEMISVYLQS